MTTSRRRFLATGAVTGVTLVNAAPSTDDAGFRYCLNCVSTAVASQRIRRLSGVTLVTGSKSSLIRPRSKRAEDDISSINKMIPERQNLSYRKRRRPSHRPLRKTRKANCGRARGDGSGDQ